MANRDFDRTIVVSFQDFDSEKSTPAQCLCKLDRVCMPYSGTNPSFSFLCERVPENENLIVALEKIVGHCWGEDSYVYPVGALPDDDPLYSLFSLQANALFRFRYSMS